MCRLFTITDADQRAGEKVEGCWKSEALRRKYPHP